MDSNLLDQIRHLCRDRAAYDHLKAILVQQARVHQISWQEHYEKLLASQSSDSPASNLLSNIIAREKALAQLADTIQRSPSLELVLQVAVQVAQKLLQVDRVAIFRFHNDGRGEFATDAIATGVESFANMPERQLSLARHMAESTQTESEGHIEKQEEQIVANIRSSSLSNHIGNLLEEIGIASFAANKIHAGQEVWGTLVAFYGNNHQSCSESDRTSLSLIAAQIGIAISLTNLRQQSHDLTEDVQTLQIELAHLHQAVAEIAASDNQFRQNLVASQDLDADDHAMLHQDSPVEPDIPVEATEISSPASQDLENISKEVQIDANHRDQESEQEPVLIKPQSVQFNQEEEVSEELSIETDSNPQEAYPIRDIDSDLHAALATLPPLSTQTQSTVKVSEIAEIVTESAPVLITEENLTQLESGTVNASPVMPDAVNSNENITSVDLAMNFEQADAPISRAISSEEIQSINSVEALLIDEQLEEVDNFVEDFQDLAVTEANHEQQPDDLVHEPKLEQVYKLPIDLCAFLEHETNSVIDSQFLEAITNRDRNLALEAIDTYLQETPLLVQAIDQAIAANDHNHLWQLLNKLRSSSGKVGALTLVYQCRQLESSIKANYVVLIYACLARVSIESQKATAALRTMRSQIDYSSKCSDTD